MPLDLTDDKPTLVQVMVSLGHNELTHWPLGDFNEILGK